MQDDPVKCIQKLLLNCVSKIPNSMFYKHKPALYFSIFLALKCTHT